MVNHITKIIKKGWPVWLGVVAFAIVVGANLLFAATSSVTFTAQLIPEVGDVGTAWGTNLRGYLLSVDSAFQYLPNLSAQCTTDQIYKYDGSLWACAADAGAASGGDFYASGAVPMTGAIQFEGATADAFELSLTVVDPTSDTTVTFQDATGAVAFTSDITSHASSTSVHHTATVDTDTTYSAGIGLAKSGTEFTLMTCADGESIMSSGGTAYICTTITGGSGFTVAGANMTSSGATVSLVDAPELNSIYLTNNGSIVFSTTSYDTLRIKHQASVPSIDIGMHIGGASTLTTMGRFQQDEVHGGWALKLFGLAIGGPSAVILSEDPSNGTTEFYITVPDALPAGPLTATFQGSSGTVAYTTDLFGGNFSDLAGSITDAQTPDDITIDLAATATALAADPANCAAGSAAQGITAAGVAESCIDVTLQSEMDTHEADTNIHHALTLNTLNNVNATAVNGDSIIYSTAAGDWINSTIAGGGGSGDITAVGDGASGDVFTANGTGTSLYFEGSTADANEILLDVVDPGADFTITMPAATGTMALTIDFDTWIELPAMTDGRILVGNASNQAAVVAMGGDVTISNTGLVAVINDSHTHGDSTVSDTLTVGASGSVADAALPDSATFNAVAVTTATINALNLSGACDTNGYHLLWNTDDSISCEVDATGAGGGFSIAGTNQTSSGDTISVVDAPSFAGNITISKTLPKLNLSSTSGSTFALYNMGTAFSIQKDGRDFFRLLSNGLTQIDEGGLAISDGADGDGFIYLYEDTDFGGNFIRLAIPAGGLASSTGVTIPNTDGTMALTSDLHNDEANADSVTVGVIETATVDETNTGTSLILAVTPDSLDGFTGSTQITTLGTVTTGNVDAAVTNASLTAAGKAEFATTAETHTGTSDALAVTPDGLHDKLTAGTVDWATTGTINGLVNVTSTTAATLTLTAATCASDMHVNGDNDVIDYTLPTAAAGQNCAFMTPFDAIMTVDTANTGDSIILDGTTLTAGNAVDSAASAGSYAYFMAISASQWVIVGSIKTWSDGGAD